MKSHWFSRRGVERHQNGDLGLVLQRPTWLLAVILDHCAESDPNMGKNWCRSLATALELNNAPSVKTLTAAMRMAWVTELRGARRYRAAVAALLINHTKQEAFAVVAGDCRIGQLSASLDRARWLTPVHTTAELLAESEQQTSHSQTLTRCLNARRFPLMEVIPIPYQSNSWILATDGHWNATVGISNGEQMLSTKMPSHIDDLSYLLLDELLELDFVETDTDSENFLSL